MAVGSPPNTFSVHFNPKLLWIVNDKIDTNIYDIGTDHYRSRATYRLPCLLLLLEPLLLSPCLVNGVSFTGLLGFLRSLLLLFTSFPLCPLGILVSSVADYRDIWVQSFCNLRLTLTLFLLVFFLRRARLRSRGSFDGSGAECGDRYRR